MKSTGNRPYYFLLSIGVCLLLMVFYFTYLRYNLVQQSNHFAIKTNDAVYGYEELADDYKSAIAIYAANGQIYSSYLDLYQDDAKDIMKDVGLVKDAAQDMESIKRADTLDQLLKEQTKWILVKHAGAVDDKLTLIIATKAIIDRGEGHARALATNDRDNLERSFLSVYQWLLILISASAALIIIVVLAILYQLRKTTAQKCRLQEIAWIQSHKVRSQVATIMGLAQLFNYKDPNDPVNAQIIQGFKECTEKLDVTITEIDRKTRILAKNKNGQLLDYSNHANEKFSHS